MVLRVWVSIETSSVRILTEKLLLWGFEFLSDCVFVVALDLSFVLFGDMVGVVFQDLEWNCVIVLCAVILYL